MIRTLLACCSALALVPQGAHAQDTIGTLPVPSLPPEDTSAEPQSDSVIIHDGMQVYLPAYFAPYAPRTAKDMLDNIPGFSVEGGGGGGQGRGLGQANGNILINGERIVIKSGSISDELARVAAGNVVRIELVEGSTLNMPGLSGRVANVIATSDDGLQGQFEWRPQLAAEYADARWWEGIVSLSGTFGEWDFTVALEGRPVRNGNGGPNIITFGDGSVQERFSESNSHGNDTRYSGSLGYSSSGGVIANLNTSYLHRRFHSFENEIVVGPMGALPLTDNFTQRNRGHDFEVGGDVDFALGPGRLKLIVLDRSQELNFRTQSVIDPSNGNDPFGSQFVQSSSTGERIGRGEYSWGMLGGDWQLSFEGAFNRLDQQGDLFLLDDTGEFVQIPFPSGTGGVREDRYESILSYGRPLTGNLSVQLAIGGEQSTIAQTGANALSRSFLRPKGSLSLAWAAADGLDVSMRIDRRVGQLNFGDFLAEVNLNDNNQNAGNNELRPDQSWGGELEITGDFGEWGSARFRTFFRRFEDFVTIIPTPGGGAARGNIEWAWVMGGEINGTLRLDPIGLEGAKFDIELGLRDSRYPDPVEGGYLPVQFAQPHNFDIDFRYDVPESDWAFGAGLRDSGFNPYYRVNEFGLQYSIDTNLRVFIEHKDFFGLTVQARFNNLLERELVLDRQVFTGPRGSSPLLFHEMRRGDVGRVVNFTIKGSF